MLKFLKHLQIEYKNNYFAIQSSFIMSNTTEQLKALSDIRNMMERSSRFISLSGLSGVFAGIYALIGAYTAYNYMHQEIGMISRLSYGAETIATGVNRFYPFFFLDAGLVLSAAFITGFYFTRRKARKAGLKMWDGIAYRLMLNLLIPLAAGGIFCLILLSHGLVGLIAPSTLLFYGLALLNASKYTFNDIRYLGMCEIILGLLSAYDIGNGLLYWALGFGILHIIYGTLMYFKYERNNA